MEPSLSVFPRWVLAMGRVTALSSLSACLSLFVNSDAKWCIWWEDIPRNSMYVWKGHFLFDLLGITGVDFWLISSMEIRPAWVDYLMVHGSLKPLHLPVFGRQTRPWPWSHTGRHSAVSFILKNHVNIYGTHSRKTPSLSWETFSGCKVSSHILSE